MPEREKHPQFPSFVQMAHVDVDAGSIWIGDGCYVLKDKDEGRPMDLGDDWGDICSRFFDRSGYSACERELWRWQSDCKDAWAESDQFQALFAERPERPADFKYDANRPEAEKCDYERFRDRLHEAENAFAQKWRSENPFTSAADTGIASFKHDLGHEGMGVMVSTYYGDGSYPVYVEYGENGRPRRILIDFDPGAGEEEDEIEADEQELAA